MIRLQRSVTVRTFDVQGTVAIGRERPELLAVARLAKDLGRPIGGRDVSRELLRGLPEQVGWQVIDRCVWLRLLERHENRGPAVLSDAGAIALEKGSVLVPEEGVWRFYWAEDELIDEPLLHVRRLESRWASDERKKLKAENQRDGGGPGQGDPTPDVLRSEPDETSVFTSLVDRQLFRIETVAEVGMTGPPGSLRLTLDWDVDRPPKVALRGELNEPEVSANDESRKAPVDRDEKPSASRVDYTLPVPSALGDVSYDEIWVKLAAQGGRVHPREVADWCARAGGRVLPVAFADGLAEDARRTMRMSVSVPTVNLDELGRFESTRLDDVVLVPRTENDAQRWAEWMQWDQIRDYETPERLREQAEAVRARFPHHRPRLLEPPALLDRARSAPKSAHARFLLAPFDLGLWR